MSKKIDLFNNLGGGLIAFNASGTADMSTTLDNSAAVNAGSGVVTIPSTGHGYLVNSYIYISGTVNFNGMYKIIAVTANTFNIAATFVAETFAGTETVTITLDPVFDLPFELFEFRIHISDGAGTPVTVVTDEDLVLTLDSHLGSNHDVVIDIPFEMVGLSDLDKVARNAYYNNDDKIKFTFTNTDGNTWALEAKYKIGVLGIS